MRKTKIRKYILFFLLTFLINFFSAKSVLASSENSFATIVNPVRGDDFWSLSKQGPLTAVKAQKEIIENNGFFATWLLRPDAIFNPKIVNYFKESPQEHELGIFLEITPVWADEAGVGYHTGALWHYANSIFLSGYKTDERKILIDTAFKQFYQVFGYYPRSVGAWHVDAYSLSYMKEKYNIIAALICADQFGTDNYQIWGSWWGVPYYPSYYNVLIPAQSEKNKLDLVIFQWAARDPVNGYGGGANESTFSIQANDYLKHGLDIDYFSKLVDVYTKPKKALFGQITVGLENDNSWQVMGREYEQQIEVLVDKNLKVVTMAEFSSWYRGQFSHLSPSHWIEGDDLVKNKGKAVWLMSRDGRIGFLEQDDKTIIRDWRIYNESWPEPYLLTANSKIDLTLSLPAKIDTIRFPESAQILTGEMKEDNFFKEKLSLPFQSSGYIFWLVILIIIAGVLISLKFSKLLAALVGLGSVALGLTMIRSGLFYSFGIGFWGANGHDGVWHLALINQVLKGFPPPHPTFSGFELTNYHYFYDLLLALINKLTTIPTYNLYFQIFPVLLAVGLGILSYLVGYWWKKDFWTGFWLAFFNYFAGSFGYLVTLWRYHEFGGESLFWSMQSISALINPPFALSLVILLFGALLLLKVKKWSLGKIAGTAFLFGILINIKAYAGMVGLAALGVYALIKLIKKEKVYLWIFGLALLISLFIFIPINHKAGSLFVWRPLWFTHSLVESYDRLYWPKMAVAIHTLKGRFWDPKLILAEAISLGLFLLGNLGTRIIGGWSLVERIRKRKLSEFDFFLMTGAVGGLIPSLLFVQKGTAWNTIQFFYYFLFFSNFYAASTMARITASRKRLKYLFLTIVILLTIPTTISTLRHYTGWPSPSAIPVGELEALNFLKSRKPGVVLTYPYDRFEKEDYLSTPLPLKVYESTSYVSAFSGYQTFLEDQVNLEISDYDWKSRREETVKFFETEDEIWTRGFLLNNQIGYIYLTQGHEIKQENNGLGVEKIFDNGEAKIYRVRGII